MTTRRHPLPAALHPLLHTIAALLGTKSFEVFGGSAHGMLTSPGELGADIDIAIRGGPEDASDCRARLAASGHCGQPTPLRPYWVHLTRPVATFNVPWSGTVLDISFMDHSPQAHFDIETVTWHYPSLTSADPWQVLGRPVTTIRLVTGIAGENPVLLLNRLLKLSAKYGLDLAADPRLRELTARIAERAAGWAPDDDFHGTYAHEAHLRHFRAATRRASDPAAFIRSCLRSGLLDALLAPLAAALRRSPGLADGLASRAATLGKEDFWAWTDTVVGAGPGWRDYRPAP